MPEHVLPGTVMGQNYARKHDNALTVRMTAKQCMSMVLGRAGYKHSYRVCDTNSSLKCLPQWGTEPLSASKAVTAVASPCWVQQLKEFIARAMYVCMYVYTCQSWGRSSTDL